MSNGSQWSVFWKTVTRVETNKIIPWIALRNAAGVAISLVAGIVSGQLTAGLIMGIGALNVGFSDGKDPYQQRGRRMLLASLFCGLAVVIGAWSGVWSGGNNLAAVLIAAIWAFVAGMVVALSPTAGDLGTVSLVTLVVFAAQPMQPHRALIAGLLACAGGLLQTLLAVASWPLRRYEPERRALAGLYAGIKAMIDEHVDASEAPPATSQSTGAQKSLATLVRDYSFDGERYRSLLNQAERARVSILAIKRLRARMRRDSVPLAPEALDRALDLASSVSQEVSYLLLREVQSINVADQLDELTRLCQQIRDEKRSDERDGHMSRDARFQLAALAGQLRAAVSLASSSVGLGQRKFESEEASRPWTLRLTSSFAILRANLTLQSPSCRHAVRLAVCIAIGDAVGRSLGWPRPYWIPMTLAIVLKPDFTSTFSRGVLRLLGTYAGLLLATGLFHLISPNLAVHIALLAIFAYLLRCFGPANYGILTAAVSGLVVLLIALTGVAPKEVIAARAFNTTVGGLLALIAYTLWPTWESRQIAEVMANLLDAYRRYLHALSEAVQDHDSRDLAAARLGGRLARSDIEASIERYRIEPGANPERLDLLMSILASSHRFAHASMSLEAALAARHNIATPPEFRHFSDDAERTMELLAKSLRGTYLAADAFPDLREDHTALLRSGGPAFSLLNTETDRIANSLNTLREQIAKWLAND